MKKSNLNIQKDGSVMVFSLFVIIIIVVLFALLILFVNMYNVIESADRVVDTAAKTRAQALDIPLKEEHGFIEIIHNGYERENYPFLEGEDKEYFKMLENLRSDSATPGYDKAILTRGNSAYLSANSFADNAAIQAGLNHIKDQYPHMKEAGDEDVTLGPIVADEKSFCFTVFPLPKEDAIANQTGDTLSTFSLGCDVEVGEGKEVISIFPPNIKIKGRDNILNRPLVTQIDGEEDREDYDLPENKRLQVVNAVFVGFAYEDTNNIFYRALKNLTRNVDPPMEVPIRTVYKIVYPQIDAHSFGSDINWVQ